MSFVSKCFVGIAYTLQVSSKYQNTKRFFYSVLEDQSYPYKKYFDYSMMLLILSSVLLLIRGVKYPLPQAAVIYNDYIISIVFMFEYMLRFWVHSSVSKVIIEQYEKDEILNKKFRIFKAFGKILKQKWKYVSSAYAIIDLLAIMPFFHELRILRLFILFRAFKIFRYTKSLQQFAQALSSKKFEFFTLMVFTSVVISVSAVLIYTAEVNNEKSAIDTMFEAFYWSFVTLSTVGYGDFVPVTDLGRTVAMFIIVSGVAVTAFTTSIVVSAFTEQLDGIKEKKMILDISRMKNFYLVCGYSEVVQIVVKRMQKDGMPFVILEKNSEKMAEAVKLKLPIVMVDPSKRDTYDSCIIDLKKQVTSVLCLEETDIQNIYTALTIRSMHPDIKILSYLHEGKNRKKLLLAGVDKVVYPQEFIGVMSKEFTSKPVAFDAVNLLRSQSMNVVMEEILINERILRTKKHVKDLNIDMTRLILLGIYKNGEFHFNPSSYMELENGVILVVIGLSIVIEEYSLNLHKAHL